jgi:hypothetical protein
MANRMGIPQLAFKGTTNYSYKGISKVYFRIQGHAKVF